MLFRPLLLLLFGGLETPREYQKGGGDYCLHAQKGYRLNRTPLNPEIAAEIVGSRSAY